LKRSSWIGCADRKVLQEYTVTKKEIVKQISERIGLTQLKTKDIVQQAFDAIVDTLIEDPSHRIELRNFGVFEVKRRKPRKARNPRTGDKVDVPAKNVVTFKPGKEMEERVRQLTDVPALEGEDDGVPTGNDGARVDSRPRRRRARFATAVKVGLKFQAPPTDIVHKTGVVRAVVPRRRAANRVSWCGKEAWHGALAVAYGRGCRGAECDGLLHQPLFEQPQPAHDGVVEPVGRSPPG
jgi:nucleoid DNA-binding protein